MNPARRVRRVVIAAVFGIATASGAHAQGLADHLTIEGVASASTLVEQPGDPTLIFDATATVRVGGGFDVVVRPYAHRLAGGDWTAEMYQLQARYVPALPLRLRLDAGILTQPVGQVSLEMLADRNPTIGGPFFLYAPLPAFSSTPQRLVVMSAGYPVGAMASASGDRWDLRGGVVDQTPARKRNPFSSTREPAAAQAVAGGGITPVPGLRVGAGWARGQYDTTRGLIATVANVEVDYSIGYTRLAGEWIRDGFEDPAGPAIVHAWTAEAVRTLSPRWLAAARASHVDAPALRGGVRRNLTAASAEATAGYRLHRDITLKAGYQTSRYYGVEDWDQGTAFSIVLSNRWW